MAAMCERAMKIGLPALVFTDHLELTPWAIDKADLLEHLRPLVDDAGVLNPDPFDSEGYFDSIERCRHRFPGLRILTGVEFGQPHLDQARARQVVDLDGPDRVNGSLHTLAVTDDANAARSEPITLYRTWPADRVVRAYLTEALRMIAGSDVFTVPAISTMPSGTGPPSATDRSTRTSFKTSSGRSCVRSPTRAGRWS
jgi:histidinol-phosphatase (PHP family)